MTVAAVNGPGASNALAPGQGVHFAVYDGEVVVLDVVADRYLGVGRRTSEAVIWSLDPYMRAEPPDAWSLLDPLVRRGLLIPGAARTPIRREPSTEREPGGLVVRSWRPHASVYLRDHQPHAGASDVLAAAWYLAWADRLLRRRKLKGLLAAIDRRSRRCAQRALVGDGPDGVDPGRIVEAHLKARMLYPRHVECLVGSAALAVQAWTLGLPVAFVIGVQKYPFYAHAWVTLRSTVMNDVPEVANRLAPILTILAQRATCESARTLR